MIIHGDQIRIHVEPNNIALDVSDPVSGFTLRGCMTAHGARKIAAQLLIAAEEADEKESA